MGGCRCSYKNCQNTTKTTDNVHYFHYPVKNKERCKIWIENANKPHFCNLEEEQLRNKVICEQHFEDKWFPNFQKKRLLQGAIPTLNGEFEVDEPEPKPETPMFISSELQDIQVLPANADGTIFILDTDTIFSRSQKVESYTYKNGMIVPSSPKQVKHEIKQCLSGLKPSTSSVVPPREVEGGYPLNHTKRSERTEIHEIGHPDYNIMIKKETPECSEEASKTSYIKTKSDLQIVEHQESFDPHKQNQIQETVKIHKKISSHSDMLKTTNKIPLEKSINRNYLRKIKQHSKDIATIKKMLRQKALVDSKPDTKVFMNAMKEQLPPTFFTVLNLNLNNKCDLTDEDVDFFTTIHKTSPEVYQLLVDKYKWNLPCVDIVESSME